jgi:hypothetical protein
MVVSKTFLVLGMKNDAIPCLLSFRDVAVDPCFIPRCHTICEYSTPLVHLLPWQKCITILSFHSTMNFNRSLVKNLITECCSSSVHVSSGAAIFTLLLWWCLFICTLLQLNYYCIHDLSYFWHAIFSPSEQSFLRSFTTKIIKSP